VFGGIFLVLLMGIAAFFLQNFYTQVKSLADSVAKLDVYVGGEVIRREHHESDHEVIDNRLNIHDQKIETHGLKLQDHETTINELKRRRSS